MIKTKIESANAEIAKVKKDYEGHGDFLEEKINEAKLKYPDVNAYNQSLADILDEAVKEITNRRMISELQAQLANALTFLSMTPEISDESAFMLVSPFLGDYTTCHSLSNSILGRTNTPVTAFTLSIFDNMLVRIENLRHFKLDSVNFDGGTLAYALSEKDFLDKVAQFYTLESKYNAYAAMSPNEAFKAFSNLNSEDLIH
jgi:hypothetical protein